MEIRQTSSNFASEGNQLSGYVAVFNQPATIREGGRTFTEVIRPGAFANALKSGADILASFNHGEKLLGRTSAGTAKFEADAHGLKLTIPDLPNHAADVKEMLARGDVRGGSFAFNVRQGGEKWTNGVRELTDLFLAEAGPVVSPAYAGTSIGLRSVSDSIKTRLKWYEKTC